VWLESDMQSSLEVTHPPTCEEHCQHTPSCSQLCTVGYKHIQHGRGHAPLLTRVDRLGKASQENLPIAGLLCGNNAWWQTAFIHHAGDEMQHSNAKVANHLSLVGFPFGWEIAHGAVRDTRRFPSTRR
jgi:hypothetical protein